MHTKASRLSTRSWKSISSAGPKSSRRGSASDRENEDFVETLVTIPPDGGWGWLIVVAAFFCNFVADGSIYTFGIFLNEIGTSFNVHPTKVALANSLMTGFYYSLGPITCALVNRYGFRPIGVIGGLISALAFVGSSYAPTLWLFLLIFGVGGGLGFGMVYVPSIVVIGFYFEKWRALATSIAVSGSAFGIICFPIIVQRLMAKLVWMDKFRIIAAGCLIASLLALLYRPLKSARVPKDERQKMTFIEEVPSGILSQSEKPGCCTRLYRRFHNIGFPTAKQVHGTSVITLATQASSSSIFLSYVGSATTMSSRPDPADRLSTVFEDDSDDSDDDEGCCTCCWKCKLCRVFRCCNHGKLTYTNRPMYRDDILYSSTLNRVPTYRRKLQSSTEGRMTNIEYHLSVTRVTTLRDVEQRGFHCCPEAIKRTLATMLDFSLLKSLAFFLLCLSGFLTLFGMYVPFIYSIERAQQNGMSKDISYFLLSAMGISNAIGRILCGMASSVPRLTAMIFSYVTLFICGVSTIASVFLKDVYGQYAYACIFGVTIASLAALRAPIVVDMLGLDKLTNAFGIIMLFEGVAGFMGIPVAGALMNATESYDTCFFMSGASITVSALIMVPINRIAEWEKKKNNLSLY